ncbi:hypothetical protein R6Q59_009987 [Mikania micrantha]
MGSLPGPQVLTYDYQYAPNAQKARNLLAAAGIPYQCVQQPFFQPRDDILDLGITYRRIPVNAIGKDFYCDNRAFYQAVQDIFPDKIKSSVAVTPADHAYESFGYRTFWSFLPLVPHHMNGKELQSDRKDLFAAFNHPNYASLHPSALAELRHFMELVEHDFLGHGKRYINGDQIGIADLHAMWMIKWALETEALGIGFGKEKGFDKSDFPRVYAWIDGVPPHDDAHDAKKIDAADAKKQVLSSSYAAADIGVDEIDPTGLKKGQDVHVATTDDATPQNTWQKGKLIGLSKKEIVIELPNTIRVHFPRIGYMAKAA